MLGGVHLVVVLGVGVLAMHGGIEEIDDVFAVVGDFEYVLLEGVLDAHVRSQVSGFRVIATEGTDFTKGIVVRNCWYL